VSTFDDIINQMASLYNVPASLISAVINQESRFNPSAQSPKGAMGLMQLMPGTFREMLPGGDPWNPADNIRAGTKYLSQMLSMFGGNVQLALAAYNSGPGTVKKYGGIPPIKETQNYVQRVMSYFNIFSSADSDSPQAQSGGGATEPSATVAGGSGTDMLLFVAVGFAAILLIKKFL
jgi:soluble lytic murein transglycosylase-like protein